MIDPAVEAAITRAHRDEWARVMATLVRRYGDVDVAEEATAQAFVVAVERWPRDGVPRNTGAWLTTTASRKALDHLRRESQRTAKHQAALLVTDPAPPAPAEAITDDRLRLLVMCCHPALAPEARVALTLRLVCGLSVAQIGRALLIPEPTAAQRITRAKRKIRLAGIPFAAPSPEDLEAQVRVVCTVVYLLFNEGYLPTSGEPAVRPGLTAEAIRLGRLLHELLPDDGEVTGLLALMLLTEARRDARLAGDGALVPLPEQDRGRWDESLVAEGRALVQERLAAVAAGHGRPGRYQLLAAVNAVHTWARTAEDTDWGQVLTLYDQLAQVDPSPVVALNRAVVVSEIHGARAGLATIEPLAEALAAYHPYHAVAADLLRRDGRPDDARRAYDRALQLTGNPAERAYLERRRAELTDGPGGADVSAARPSRA